MTITYEYRVSQALEEWLTKTRTRDSLTALASLLGCEHMGAAQIPSEAAPLGLATEVLVQQAWISLLQEYDQGLPKTWILERYLVAGLLQNDRWRRLLDTEQAAHSWVSLLARFQSRGPAENKALPLHDIDMNRSVSDALRGVLIDWLAPHYGTGDYVQRDFARAFFGEAWCAMVLDSCHEDVSLATLIDSTRPPFVPGRLNTDVVHTAQTLPELVS